ncbi:MAG: GNAT family N-acetyltransferase [bacterium]|nr:GNAT family N-acetyltransferase [bacterium]
MIYEFIGTDRLKPARLAELSLLFAQLNLSRADKSSTPKPLCESDVRRCVDENFFLVAADGQGETERFVGMGTLIVFRTISGARGTIEHVAVDPAFRRQGIAEAVVNRLLEEARTQGCRYIDLTSHARREAANHLYQKIGFERRETNHYRFMLKQS